MGMIGVLEITLIVPTLRVGMPPRTLREGGAERWHDQG